MLQIKKGFQVLPGTKVIKAEDYAAYVKAHDIIEGAKKEAERIIEEANEVYESEKVRGYEEGKHEGDQKSTEHLIKYLSKKVDSYGVLEDKILSLVMGALKQILGEMDENELVKKVVHNALKIVSNQKEMVLKVNPSQSVYLREQMSEMIKGYPGINFIDVKEDERLGKGDCIIETDFGVIDGRVETQLEIMRKAFKDLIR